MDDKITHGEKQYILGLSRDLLEKLVRREEPSLLIEEKTPPILKEKCGLFVTLYKNGDLRGCIGRITSDIPAYELLPKMLYAAAFEDYRFENVTPDELDEITFEISLLTPLKKINHIGEIELGKHGVYLKKGFNSGTFLPKVATTMGWGVEELLGHCCRDKAQMDWEDWKKADISTYESLVIKEEE